MRLALSRPVGLVRQASYLVNTELDTGDGLDHIDDVLGAKSEPGDLASEYSGVRSALGPVIVPKYRLRLLPKRIRARRLDLVDIQNELVEQRLVVVLLTTGFRTDFTQPKLCKRSSYFLLTLVFFLCFR